LFTGVGIDINHEFPKEEIQEKTPQQEPQVQDPLSLFEKWWA
jgi:hypothetical protein